MNSDYGTFLTILKCALKGETYNRSDPLTKEEWIRLVSLAREHHVLPMVAEALNACPAVQDNPSLPLLRKRAVKETISQAARTAEFLSLYSLLEEQGYKTVVMKGVLLRCFYPFPEQRPSVDEDLLIDPDDCEKLHKLLTELGFRTEQPETDLGKAAEITYFHSDRRLCLEVHSYPFPPDSPAYGECTRFFKNVSSDPNLFCVNVYGQDFLSLSPTDHLLYMIFHGYKHFLHSGVGIRQICDMGIYAENYHEQIDWVYILNCCKEIQVDLFAAALFKIGSSYLDFRMPEIFSSYAVDENNLLDDILSGGLYGTEDINRVHSATITLNMTAARRRKRYRGNLLKTIFPPKSSLEGRYPYLASHGILLPVAWTQRIIRYLTSNNRPAPVKSIRIGRDRVKLLKEYGIID